MRIRVFGMTLVVLLAFGLENLAAEKVDDEAMAAFEKGKTLFIDNQ